MSFSSSFWTRAATVPASLPAVIYVRDSFFGLSHVHGSSMEPSLKDGDVVLVRKCEAGTFTSSLWLWTTNRNNNVDADRECAVRHERLQQKLQSGMGGGESGWIASRPPLVLPGQVLVYQNPLSLTKEYFVKRVAAVGGQWLRHEHPTARPEERFETTRYYYDYRLEALPPHTVYVEGDNQENSVDSRSTGPVSKNLAVGVAEYVVWPPTRWQRIQRQPPTGVDGQPRAIWY